MGFAVYWNGLSGPFVFDDQLSIVENPYIREWWRPGRVFFPERELPVAGRPLVNFSFALNYAVNGLQVRGYHLGNVAIHVACALLVFGIVRLTLQSGVRRARFGETSTNIGFAAALLWMVHPLNTEAVDYLTQRTELLMAFFYLLTLYACIRAFESRRPLRWHAAAVLSCASGMACKESMVTAPVMIILYDRIFIFASLREALRARWRLYTALAATWLLLGALLWAGPRIHSAGFSTDVGPWTYLLNQTTLIMRYIGLAIWPRALVLNYGTPATLTFGDVAPFALGIALLLMATLVALVRWPQVGFLGAWFFIMLAPTSSFVPIATEVGAERRMYLPLIALVVLSVLGSSAVIRLVTRMMSRRSDWLPSRASMIVSTMLLIVVCAALSAATISRNREYSSSLSLARTVLERYPTSMAHHMVGAELSMAGQHEEAEAELRRALPGAPRAHYALGVELFRQGKLDEAVDELQLFIKEQPQLLEVVSARELMAQIFAQKQQWARAADQYRALVTMAPYNPDFQRRLAESLFQQQTFDEAAAQYAKYLRARPNDVAALTNLGVALIATGKLDDAISAFRRAADADPRNPDTHRNLANALFDRRDFDEAAAQARLALTLRPDDPASHDALGRALAQQGKLEEAQAQFVRALQIDPGNADARDDLEQLRQHVARSRAATRP